MDLSELKAVFADRYRIERELGRGGAATVYLAEDRKHGRQVALKVLRPEVAMTLGAERFLREIRTAARLQHPHIVPLHDSGEVSGFLYYVMPYLEGASLRDWLTREPQLGLEQALQITREVADALEYAHGLGFVHRDIKPENILISAGTGAAGHALVTDFGIAKALTDAGGDNLTETGLAVGTPSYMSPEQAAADRIIDGRADLYALGCVLYEMLAGHPPFQGRTARELLARHSLDPVPPLRTLRRELPPGVERAVFKSLAKAPADRYATVSAFMAALTEGASGRRSLRRTAMIGTGVVAGFLLIGLALRTRGQRPVLGPSAADSAPSIAVLAFANVGGDATYEPFSDGVADELTTALGKIGGLSVAARTSAFSFKGKGLDPRDIGRRLGVRYIVEGTVRQAGGRRRVTAELIDVTTGKELWSDNFEPDPADRDVFAVQDSITRAIVRGLRLSLAGGALSGSKRRSTESAEAHDLYLQGRFFFAKRDLASLAKARDYFTRAIDRDSSYAEAYAGLAETYAQSSIFGGFPPHEVFPKAKVAVRRALELDSTLVEARTAQGFIALFYDWDWPAASREFDRALALDPRYAPAHLFNGWYFLATGELDRAIAEFREAQRLEPFAAVNTIRLADAYFYARRYEEALGQARRLLELEPGYFQSPIVPAQTQLAMGRCQEALKALTTGPEQLAGGVRGLLGYAYAKCGHRDRALAELDRLLAAAKSGRYVTHFGLAMIHAGLSDLDRAFAELDLAVAERAWAMIILRVRPEFDGLRDDPRYPRLLEKIGLKP